MMCLAVEDPLATAALYRTLGFGIQGDADTQPLNPEHPLLIITHDGKPALMVQTDTSLRELLPTISPSTVLPASTTSWPTTSTPLPTASAPMSPSSTTP